MLPTNYMAGSNQHISKLKLPKNFIDKIIHIRLSDWICNNTSLLSIGGIFKHLFLLVGHFASSHISQWFDRPPRCFAFGSVNTGFIINSVLMVIENSLKVFLLNRLIIFVESAIANCPWHSLISNISLCAFIHHLFKVDPQPRLFTYLTQCISCDYSSWNWGTNIISST